MTHTNHFAVQTKPTASSCLRAQILHLLREGGLGHDTTHPDIASHADRRILAEARKGYARKLKDKFLSGPARFLLRDQTPEGISVLESKLTGEIDLALKFSLLVWGRKDTVDIKFSGLEGSSSDYLYNESKMEVYDDGARDSDSKTQDGEGEKKSLPVPPPSQEVTMVLQPTITCTIFSSSSLPNSEPQPQTTIISKAVVLLSNAFPPPSPSPSPSKSTTLHATTPDPACSAPLISSAAISSPQENSFRLSMTACPGTPTKFLEEGLESGSQEMVPAASGKSTGRSPQLKLRSSPDLKLGGSGWMKDAGTDRSS